jgi:hypothetical protein
MSRKQLSQTNPETGLFFACFKMTMEEKDAGGWEAWPDHTVQHRGIS